jgi:hypothetical protein
MCGGLAHIAVVAEDKVVDVGAASAAPSRWRRGYSRRHGNVVAAAAPPHQEQHHHRIDPPTHHRISTPPLHETE